MSILDLEADEGELGEDGDVELVVPLPLRVKRALAAEVWPDWWMGAPCASADPDAWFPDAFPVEQVLRTCQACPLRRPCLAAGILGNEHGIWAGTSRVQRSGARCGLAQGPPVPVILDQLLHGNDLLRPADGAAAGFEAAA